MGRIPIHPEYGVNPTISQCFVCQEDKNEVVLLGNKYRGKAPVHMMLDTMPCEKCQGYMQKGVILISVRDGEKGENPYRTGGWIVLKLEAASEIFNMDLNKQRMFFIEDSMWDKLGFPERGKPIEEENKG